MTSDEESKASRIFDIAEQTNKLAEVGNLLVGLNAKINWEASLMRILLLSLLLFFCSNAQAEWVGISRTKDGIVLKADGGTQLLSLQRGIESDN